MQIFGTLNSNDNMQNDEPKEKRGNNETIRESMPVKKLLNQLLIQMFPTYEKNIMFRNNVSY